jgi:catechol 2,3-dioxygenase-like lactoylglutathione lyase family enzyme
MKRFPSNKIISIAALFTFLSIEVSAQVKLNHIAVYVEDLAVSTQFYENLIGLKKIEEPFKDGLHTWFALGASQLHLIQGDWEEVTINKNNHLCFGLEDMDAFIERLKAQQIAYEDWPGKANTITTRVDGVRQVYFKDPNGYWIEVNDDY